MGLDNFSGMENKGHFILLEAADAALVQFYDACDYVMRVEPSPFTGTRAARKTCLFYISSTLTPKAKSRDEQSSEEHVVDSSVMNGILVEKAWGRARVE